MQKLLLAFIALFGASCAHHIKPAPEQASARLSIINDDKTETVFYLTTPKSATKFPIAVVCEGSSLANDLESVWRLHQYARKDLEDPELAILTIEKHGVDIDKIDRLRFFSHR